MKRYEDQKQNTLLGERTPAANAGFTYTLTAGVMLTFSFLFLLALAAVGVRGEEVTSQNWYLYCSYLLTPLAFVCVIGWSLRWSKTPILTEIKAQKCKGKYFLLALLLQIGLLSLSELNTLFIEFLAIFGYQSAEIALPTLEGIGLIGVLLVVAVLPAVFEEWIFRGLLVRGMKSAFGTVGTVLIGGSLFSLYHQNPAQTAYQFCCGAAFALIAIRAGSILPTIISHFLNNALIILLTKFGVDTLPKPVWIAVLILSISCLVASFAYLIFWDKTKRETSVTGTKKQFVLGSALGIAICVAVWILQLFGV
jgi:membrane protease YdiL (CAAX protease family)